MSALIFIKLVEMRLHRWKNTNFSPPLEKKWSDEGCNERREREKPKTCRNALACCCSSPPALRKTKQGIEVVFDSHCRVWTFSLRDSEGPATLHFALISYVRPRGRPVTTSYIATRYPRQRGSEVEISSTEERHTKYCFCMPLGLSVMINPHFLHDTERQRGS